MVDLDGQSLYEALGLVKDASQADIRKAYMRLALQLHPDKNPGDEGAAAKFQTLQKVYSILSDADKRKVYDQTGSVEDAEELAGERFGDLYRYYRGMYGTVTEADVQAFHDSYQGGEEERRDLLRYYCQFKGDMRKVFAWVMCSEEAADSHRFMDVLDAAIAAKQVPSFAKYIAWAKRTAAKPRPKPEAAPAKGKGRGRKQQDAGSEAALVAQIRGRQQQGALALPGSSALGRLMAEVDNSMPSEEDFQAARQRLGKGKQRSSGSGKGKQKGGPAAETAQGTGSKRSRTKK